MKFVNLRISFSGFDETSFFKLPNFFSIETLNWSFGFLIPHYWVRLSQKRMREGVSGRGNESVRERKRVSETMRERE